MDTTPQKIISEVRMLLVSLSSSSFSSCSMASASSAMDLIKVDMGTSEVSILLNESSSRGYEYAGYAGATLAGIGPDWMGASSGSSTRSSTELGKNGGSRASPGP